MVLSARDYECIDVSQFQLAHAAVPAAQEGEEGRDVRQLLVSRHRRIASMPGEMRLEFLQ
jgi:hypothetical protein